MRDGLAHPSSNLVAGPMVVERCAVSTLPPFGYFSFLLFHDDDVRRSIQHATARNRSLRIYSAVRNGYLPPHTHGRRVDVWLNHRRRQRKRREEEEEETGGGRRSARKSPTCQSGWSSALASKTFFLPYSERKEKKSCHCFFFSLCLFADRLDRYTTHYDGTDKHLVCQQQTIARHPAGL